MHRLMLFYAYLKQSFEYHIIIWNLKEKKKEKRKIVNMSVIWIRSHNNQTLDALQIIACVTGTGKCVFCVRPLELNDILMQIIIQYLSHVRSARIIVDIVNRSSFFYGKKIMQRTTIFIS